MDRISAAANHLLNLVDDILDLAKIESGKLELDEIDFRIDELLLRAINLVMEPARDKGLELVIDSDDVPEVIRADPTRLSQALVNLLANAVKFTAKGFVTLSARVVSETDGKAMRLRFEVRDSGPGIAEQDLAKLFNAFEQGDASTTRRFGGTGLGLAITRHIARLMGGDAYASSTIGIGSRFWFDVMLWRSGNQDTEATHRVRTRERVLVVDDLPEAREALSNMLKRMDFRVAVAKDAVEALALVGKADHEIDPFATVLVDKEMPTTDGIDFVAAMRRRNLASESRVIIMATQTASDVLIRQEELKIADFLIKPISFGCLYDALTKRHPEARSPSNIEKAEQKLEQLIKANHAGARILLAEDNVVNQLVARSLLDDAGLIVDVADNGNEAISLATTRTYSLVLMDMQMPELDGLEATRQIRQMPEHQRLPIIAMTANVYLEDRKACSAAGMNDFLSKPVLPDDSYRLLLEWLDPGKL